MKDLFEKWKKCSKEDGRRLLKFLFFSLGSDYTDFCRCCFG